MKNYLYPFIIVLIFALMGGCANASDEKIKESNAKEPEVSNDKEPFFSSDDEGPSSDENNAATPGQENKDDDLVEVEEVEETKPRYVLQSDHSVKPIAETDNDRVVLLTIDDAPENYGVEIAEILKEKDINAIFFVNGHFISSEAGREKLQTIHDLGFEIGNHTMTHANLTKLSEEKQREEIVKLNDIIEEITGDRPRFFRAPFGMNTDVSRQVVTEENMQWMNWSYG